VWVEIIVNLVTGVVVSGHTGDTRSGHTRKKPIDLSVREREEREERGRVEGGGVYVVCIR
jgi:hypothetical protein